jgi:aminobenzoyl-glutamate utilization protein B
MRLEGACRCFVVTVSLNAAQAQAPAARPRFASPQLTAYRTSVWKRRDGREHPEENDTVFSFAELGFQEYETTRYLTGILEQNGFKIERGVAGIPTA